MADSYVELYSNTLTNSAVVAVDEALYFGNTTEDRQAKLRFSSSLSFFDISSSSSQKIEIRLDGTEILLRMNGSGSITLPPQQGKSYSYCEVFNRGTADITANDLNVRYGISVRQDQVKPETLKRLLSTKL